MRHPEQRDHGVGPASNSLDGASPRAARTFYSFTEDSTAGQGRWDQGKTLVGDQDIVFTPGVPLADDDGTIPAPDPLLFGTYDGSQGLGAPGTEGGIYGSGSLLQQPKDKLTSE